MLFNILTISYSTSPQPPPLLQMQDGGGVLFCNQPPIPPLLEAQDGGGRLPPCSKRKTEREGSPPTTPPTPSHLKCAQDGGGRFLLQPPPYSLPARNARRRERVLLQPPLLPPTRNARVRREVLLPLPPLPCSKRKTEKCFFFNHPPLLPPLLETQDGRAFSSSITSLLPPLLETQDGGGGFSSNHPSPLSFKT